MKALNILFGTLFALTGWILENFSRPFTFAILDTVVKYEGENAGFFLKPVTENPTITDFGFEVIDGALVDQWIYLNDEVDKITKVYGGCGTKTDTDLGANITRKELEPVKLEIYKTQCADVFDDTVFRKNVPAGVEAGNLTSGEILQMLLSFINPVITRDALRIAFLGDTALSDPDYNQIDGIFKQLAAAAVSDGMVDIGSISDTDINTTNILTTLKTIRDARHRKLKQRPKNEQAIIVTDSIFDAYQTKLEENDNLESARKKLISGQEITQYHGVDMIPVGLVDEYLEADFASGSPAVITGEHRIIWTWKKNIVLAIDTAANYNQVKFGYDDRDDINWYKARYQMDVNYKYPELTAIGGF